MSKKQLIALFLCSLVPWTAGNGLVPLLPVYATHLGADSAVSGYYLAFSYLAIALGALSAGWVSDQLNRRKFPLILAGIVGIPIVWLMGQISTIWGLTILTAILWFCGGLGLALIGILTGLSVLAGQLFRYTALGYSPVSVVQPLIGTSVLFVLLLSFMVNRKIDVFNFRVIIGILVIVLGTFLIFL